MSPLDWAVMAATIGFIILYGLWRSRGTATTSGYLLAGREMPWYAMALSIMATQASAVTFISTTGQSYVDGMRFVQFYFGLPLAMIIISMTAVPIFHRAGVFTAYEYLERRFDAKTRLLVSSIFLIQRGLAVGVSLSAPAIVLTVIFGWPDQITTAIMGAIIVAYTVAGGIKAITWTDVQQMIIMFLGLLTALILAVQRLPADISLIDAIRVAGAAGRINPVTTAVDWNDRYNLWSGLIGGMFLALSYFGCDQSQVQRYLTGRSVAQSRLSLLFNAVAKIPMQFFILFVGAMVFSFYTFEKPPVLFHGKEAPRFGHLSARFDQLFEERRDAAREMLQGSQEARQRFQEANSEMTAIRKSTGVNDTNYVFLSFVSRYMPAGVVGLLIAVILAAAITAISGEVNSLATVTVIDIYKRNVRRDASDHHYFRVSQIATAFWGIYAVATAQYSKNLGSLIEAVNIVGSLFYGGLLGVFTLAFYFPRIGANAAFAGVLAGEAAIFATRTFTGISFLWYNVVGCVVVVASAHLVQMLWPARGSQPPSGSPVE
jgi:Na+/proline symporter